MLKNEGGNKSKDSSDSEDPSILPDENGQVILEEVFDESYEPNLEGTVYNRDTCVMLCQSSHSRLKVSIG